MSLTQSHEELQQMLPAAALGILDPADLAQVLGHVRECQECVRLLQEYREVAAALSLQLPRRQLDPGRGGAVRARLLARASGPTRIRDDRAAERRARRLRVDQWSGWAVAAGLAGLLLIHHSVHRPLDYGWLATGVLAVVLIGLAIYARVQRSRVSALEDRLGGPGPHGGRGSAPPGPDLTPA